MRPQKGLVLIIVGVSTILLTPHTAVTPGREFAGAACVRLPWQPKNKCSSTSSSRMFATSEAKSAVADALESAYSSVLEAVAVAQNAARKIRDYNQKHKTKLGANLPEQSRRYAEAVLALGSLVDAYPQSVQPKQLAWFAPRYQSVKRCYPECQFDWIATLVK